MIDHVHIGWGRFARALFGGLSPSLNGWRTIALTRNSDVELQMQRQSMQYQVVPLGEPLSPTFISRPIFGVVNTKQHRDGVVDLLADADIITLTITAEALGSNVNPNVARDHGISLLVEALEKVYLQCRVPPVLLSLDNVRTGNNGDALRWAACKVAEFRGGSPEFLNWINREVSFRASIADRIVPEPSDELRSEWEDVFVRPMPHDRLIAFTEPAPKRQVVIEWPENEHRYIEVKSALCTVDGIEITNDIRPWTHMKSWMLNGSHAVIGMAGLMRGHGFAHQAIRDSKIEQIVWSRLLAIARTLPPEMGEIGLEFASEVITRLRNEELPDALHRLVLNIPNKIPRIFEPMATSIRSGTGIEAHLDCVSILQLFLANSADGDLGSHFMCDARALDSSWFLDSVRKTVGIPDEVQNLDNLSQRLDVRLKVNRSLFEIADGGLSI